jgi:thiamine biosynthesis protein ThiS
MAAVLWIAAPIVVVTSEMQILVNGQTRDVCSGTTLLELVAQLELTPEHIAVEVNRELVPRRQHDGCELADGDCLEVVTLVGGG